LATDANGRYGKLDPRTGARLALAEAYRNVATTGARPLAVTDCLNFGSPEDPDSMWQLVEAIEGLAEACRELGVPVTGGNVSLYNGTGEPGQIDSSIHPTPVVGVLGVLDDVAHATPSGWRETGESIYLLGTTRAELDGSAWADVEHGHLGGVPPRVDLAAESAPAAAPVNGSRAGLVCAAHARESTWRPRRRSPACSSTRAATTSCRPRTTSPRAGSRRGSSRRRCASASGPPCRSTR